MDQTAEYVRLWPRHQAEVGCYVYMMIPRAAEVLQEVSVLLWKKWVEKQRADPKYSTGGILSKSWSPWWRINSDESPST